LPLRLKSSFVVLVCLSEQTALVFVTSLTDWSL